MVDSFTHRAVENNDLDIISKFPQNEDELYFMFPKAVFPLTVDQMQTSIDSRYDSTVILCNDIIVGFANFYEAIVDQHCSIGNVIVNPLFRGKGAGKYLIGVMESIAIKKYTVSEIHISCFNLNVIGLLLYHKLGYFPYDIEKWIDKKSNQAVLIKMKKEIKK